MFRIVKWKTWKIAVRLLLHQVRLLITRYLFLLSVGRLGFLFRVLGEARQWHLCAVCGPFLLVCPAGHGYLACTLAILVLVHTYHAGYGTAAVSIVCTGSKLFMRRFLVHKSPLSCRPLRRCVLVVRGACCLV